MSICGRRIDGASDIKVEIFRPLFDVQSQPLVTPDQVSHKREVTHDIRRDGSDDPSNTNRRKITGEHLVIPSAGLRSNLSIGIDNRWVTELTVTLITLSLRVAVVTNQATIPTVNPAIAPPMHPHLFAFFHVMASAIGTTALPKRTPMNVYGRK